MQLSAPADAANPATAGELEERWPPAQKQVERTFPARGKAVSSLTRQQSEKPSKPLQELRLRGELVTAPAAPNAAGLGKSEHRGTSASMCTRACAQHLPPPLPLCGPPLLGKLVGTGHTGQPDVGGTNMHKPGLTKPCTGGG